MFCTLSYKLNFTYGSLDQYNNILQCAMIMLVQSALYRTPAKTCKLALAGTPTRALLALAGYASPVFLGVFHEPNLKSILSKIML